MKNNNELNKIIEQQDKVLIEMMNDVRIPSYIRDQHAEKYNELHINILQDKLFGDDENK